MFTNEFNFSETITTVLDETGEYTDVEVIIDDDCVYIRQFPDDDHNHADLITMSHKMYRDLIIAMDKPEGLFKTKYL